MRRKMTMALISVAVLATLAMTVAVEGRNGPVLRWLFGPRKAVVVHEVRVDRKGRAYLDIVFSEPVASARAGEVLATPPASLKPPLNGVWRWYTGNALRFEPAGQFPIASQYELKIDAARIGTKELPFDGPSEFEVKTDDFLVRRVTWSELPLANGFVVLQGETHFNYRVSPEALAPRIHLTDGDATIRIELITSYESDSITWRTPPLQKQKQQREVQLVIDESLFPAEGNVTLGTPFKQPIAIGSNEVLAILSATAAPSEHETVIRIALSSAVTADALAGKLTVMPDVKFRIEIEGNDALLIGKFKPGHSYDLAVAEGLLALDKALLRESYQQTVAVADLPQLLAFQSEGMFLSLSGRKNIAIDTINVSAGKLAIDRVYRNNLFFYLQSAGRSYYDEDEEWDTPYYRAYYDSGPVAHRYGDRIVEKALAFRSTPNVRATSTIPIGSLVKESSPGLYRVSVSRNDDEWDASTRWILITDLGIVVKRSQHEVVVWVASFKNLAPIDNASVTIVDDQNQPLGRGTTDSRGFWTARNISDKANPFMITVERGGDFSFLLLGDSQVDMSAYDVGGASLPKSGYLGFLYGERTLYRPGETMHGVAVVRTNDLAYPPSMPLVLKHLDPAGEQREAIRLTPDARGTAAYDLALPAYSRTGNHTLNLVAGDLVIGSTSFNVEEFVPDRIKVEIETPKDTRPGDFEFAVTSAYLFGAPAAALGVDTKVRLAASPFRPPGYEEFTFDASSRKFETRELSSDSGTLDEQGRKDITVAIPAKLAVPSSLQAIITSRVQEQGGRGVAAMTRVPVHPYPYYLGVRELQSHRAQNHQFEWVAIAPNGKETASSPLRVDIFEERWHTVLRQSSSGGYTYESTKDSEQLKTISVAGGKTRGIIPFTTRGWGSYRLVVTDPVTLASTELTFEAWDGRGYSPWAMKNPGRLELSLDKTAHQSGQNALLTIKSPFRGKALITVERDRVFYTATATLDSNTARIEVPLTAESRPNAYITATVVRTADDLEPGEAGRAFGAIRVDVDRDENELAPEITVVREMRSARALGVTVRTRPHAQVTIAAVDQGILQLVSEQRPDPFGYFYQRRALDVITHDIFALLLPEVAAKNKAIAGGSESGEGIAQFLRTDGMRRPKAVSFWSGVLAAGSDGIVRTSFDIPDFQGAVRVTAVVHTEAQFGSSDALVIVRDPIVMLPTAPRFVSTGDTFSLPVTVRNDTKTRGTFVVTAKVTGNATLSGNASQQIVIERQREATVLFTLRASDVSGGVNLAFTASGNNERAVAAAGFPVYPSLPDATDEMSGSIADRSFRLPVVPPQRFREGSAKRELIISPLPLIQFRGRLDYLVRYPYGCVEQTTSTSFPLVYLADLATELDPHAFRTRPAAGYVRDGIRRLATMQTVTGAFSMWPYGSDANVWGSIYATHFLTEAKRAGYSVDVLRYNSALDYLAQLAKARPDYDQDGLQQALYALYVLGRAGRPDLGTMDYIREKQAPKLTFESRALLGAAYATTGNASAVTAMLSDIEREDAVTRQTGSNYNSTVRNRALVLLALLDASPNDPRVPHLASRIARELVADRYYTTQDSAMGLVALGQYLRARKSNATYKGTLLLDGRPLGSFDGKTARFENIAANGELKVVFENGYVPNAAYYALRVRGTPAEETFTASSEGLRVQRTFLTRDGVPLTSNEVRQGDIVVIRTDVASVSGPMQNVVVQNVLPAGLEVENPRLTTTETLPWVQSISMPQHADIRDDRVLFFVDLDSHAPLAFYTVARAITPGTFKLPPAQTEAMYAPAFRATEPLRTFKVVR
jgi:uncharacterized protein YfaS (alpha-2-macroglobulin family)